MLTYITGDFMVTHIAEGVARNHTERKESVKVFFSGATKAEIVSAIKKHAHVVVCWQNCYPINVPDSDCLIKTVHPMTIVKAPDNIIEILGEYTHVGTFTTPLSRFSQPTRHISMVDGDGEYLLNQQHSKEAA